MRKISSWLWIILLLSACGGDEKGKKRISAIDALPEPVISDISPRSTVPGGTIRIQGINFGKTQGKEKINIGSAEITPTIWEPTVVFATLPEGMKPGELNVSVNRNGHTSNEMALVVSAATEPNELPTLGGARIDDDLTYYFDSTLMVSPFDSDDADNDPTTFEFRWYVNKKELTGETKSTLAPGRFKKNDKVYCFVSIFDEIGKGETVKSNEITIQNTLPTIGAVTVGSGPWVKASAITVTIVDADDKDGDKLSYSYEWFINDNPVAYNGPKLDGTYFNRDDKIFVRVRPHDGDAYGLAVDSAEVTISDSPPSAPAIGLYPALPTSGSGLSVSILTPSVDADGDALTYRYRWLINNVVQSSLTNQISVPANVPADGEVWRIEVRAFDGALEGPATVLARTIIPTWRTVAAGELHTCGIRLTGALYCWGESPLFGDDVESSLIPRLVPGGNDWTSITSGDYFSCGIKDDQSLWCWGGYIDYGQTGSVNSTEPMLMDAALWNQVDAGEDHACGVDAANLLWCWGKNEHAQLGNGDTISVNSPSPVTGTGWRSVSAGKYHSCADKLDGTVWCWGTSHYGETGSVIPLADSTTMFTEPVQVGTDSDWSSVRAGDLGSCALKSDQSLYCWGNSLQGQFGLGTLGYSEIPSLTPITTTTYASNSHNCAVDTNGALYCWGYGQSGQVGNNITIQAQMTPYRVGADSDWRSITTGSMHTCGLKASGIAYCWGSNAVGQLGDGTIYNRYAPVIIVK